MAMPKTSRLKLSWDAEQTPAGIALEPDLLKYSFVFAHHEGVIDVPMCMQATNNQ